MAHPKVKAMIDSGFLGVDRIILPVPAMFLLKLFEDDGDKDTALELTAYMVASLVTQIKGQNIFCEEEVREVIDALMKRQRAEIINFTPKDQDERKT